MDRALLGWRYGTLMVTFVFDILTIVFESVAVFLLAWGGVLVLGHLAISEWKHILGKGDRIRFEQIRVEFGQRIVLATEFLIAADLVRTILDPSLQEGISLGGIVTIRTVLSYFLTQEVDRHERVWKR